MKEPTRKRRFEPRDQIDEGPYHHPILEEQLIIRFPPDIAARLSDLMEDDDQSPFSERRFEDFRIHFIDDHHARVDIFDEKLEAVLVRLPAYLESHRTVDGSHLFKSGDICEMLIVYRHNSPPQGVTPDFVFEHGLTPPMRDIVSKRQAKTEHAKSLQDATLLEGIDYWEIVEIQLAALVSKEHTAKPVCRHEFHEEPDEDPVILEKVLRTHGHPELRGYSGVDISDEELSEIVAEDDPIIEIPKELFAREERKEEEVEIEVEFPQQVRSEEEEDIELELELGSSPTPSPQVTATEGETEGETESESEDENENEEEEDEEESELDNMKKRLEVLEKTRYGQQKNADNARNEEARARMMVQIRKLDEQIETLKQQIAAFERGK
jgi:transcription initiation factor TFIID subunit 7